MDLLPDEKYSPKYPMIRGSSRTEEIKVSKHSVDGGTDTGKLNQVIRN
jgi:hypothetical protein